MYDFVPETYCLPGDLHKLKVAWDEAGSKGKWILKPVSTYLRACKEPASCIKSWLSSPRHQNASARGIGIRVVHDWAKVPKEKSYLVQQYLSDPYLINEAKFDLRIYVYVSSFDPLRVYVCRDGLVRFATQKYSNKKSALKNRYMHLTNYR